MITIKLVFEILLLSTFGSRGPSGSEKTMLPPKETYVYSIRSEDDAGRGRFY